MQARQPQLVFPTDQEVVEGLAFLGEEGDHPSLAFLVEEVAHPFLVEEVVHPSLAV